ncbi:MAG: arginase family protein, partial [Chloroflexota bacterium]
IDATGIEVAGTDIDRALQCIQQLDAEKIYVHVDLDTLDPAHFSALGFPTPDGLSPEQVETVLAATKDRMAGLLITSLDPEHDSAEQAIRIAGELAIFGLIT